MKTKKDPVALFIKKIFKILRIKLTKKNEKLFIQIFKFGIVGGIATVIDFGCIFILREFIHLSVLVANTLSFCISTIYNYIASVKWVFNVNEEKDKRKTFITFIIFSVIGLILNDLIMWFTTDMFNIYYMLGKIIATCFVMVFNFITRKLFLE